MIAKARWRGERPILHVQMMIISGVIACWALRLAYFMHLQNRRWPTNLVHGSGCGAGVLEHKYWVDEIYQATIVEPLRNIGRCCMVRSQGRRRLGLDGRVCAAGLRVCAEVDHPARAVAGICPDDAAGDRDSC